MLGAAVASAAALAACFLLVVQPWRRTSTPERSPLVNAVTPTVEQVVAIKDQFIQALQQAVPADGEAVVLRLRVSRDVPLAEALDAALGKAGIASLASDLSTGATPWQEAYRRSLEAKYGPVETENTTLVSATVEAAQAVFIEAPLERLEGALTELESALNQPLKLQAESKLALAGVRESGPEGEPGSATGQAFAQRLNASLFRLEKKLAEAAVAAVNPKPAGKPPTPQQRVRVLILVETQ
jgi:hypothetical protein